MSDELLPEADEETLAFETEADEYEEISSDEVDRVVANLEELMETVESENVRLHLEEALNTIYYLVYEESEEEPPLEEAA